MPNPAPARTASYHATVALLGLAVFINYADRGNLSTAAPVLQSEFHISSSMLGVLLSSFFWVYAPAQLLAGSATQRFGVRRTLAVGLALWSLATLLTGFASGLTMLLALRMLLGVGEAAIFPCATHFLAEVVPEHARGRANGFINSGMAFGPMAGTFAGGMILAAFGWRWVFFAFGVASLAWLVPWLLNPTPAPHADAEAVDEWKPSYLDILRQRAAWGAALGHFCVNYCLYLLLTWLPTYLVKNQGFTLRQMATIGACVYLLQASGCLFSGWLSDRLIRRGMHAGVVRKAILLTGIAASGAAMLGVGFTERNVAVALLGFGGFSMGLLSPMMYASAQRVAGPRAAGRWMGLQNFVGNLAGIVVPIVTGVVVERTGSYFWAFAIAAAVSAGGLLCWGVVVGRIEPVEWRRAGRG